LKLPTVYIYYNVGAGKTQAALAKGAFAGDVLALGVCEGAADGYSKEVDINGEKVLITLAKAEK
jgi:hypothetical protein